jgi:hypothetical protein
MIAVINHVVAGVGIALLTRWIIPSAPSWAGAASAVTGALALALTWLFYAYQRWRFDEYDIRAGRRIDEDA